MKPVTRRQLRRCALATAAVLSLGACKEDQTAEIKKLNEELDLSRENYASQRDLAEEREKEIDKAYDQVAELKSELREVQGQLRDAERDLVRYRQQEEAAAKAEAEKPSVKEMLEAAKESVSGKRESRVAITGDAVNGSGLLVTADDKTWIYVGRDTIERNAKLEIKTVGGTTLSKFGAFELAADVPLARIEVLDEGATGLALPQQAADTTRSLALLSFDESGSLVEGRSYGEGGPESLRVDSRIGASPAGSPVFHGESGELLGLILAAPRAERTLWPDAYQRRAADATQVYRLDRKIEWSAVPIGAFLEEARLIEQGDQLTRLVHAFAATTSSPAGLSYGGLEGGMQAEELLKENAELAVVKEFLGLDEWLRQNSERTSKSDVNKKIGSVYSQIQRTALRQTKDLENRRFSKANAEAAALTLEWRKEAMDALAKRLASLE